MLERVQEVPEATGFPEILESFCALKLKNLALNIALHYSNDTATTYNSSHTANQAA